MLHSEYPNAPVLPHDVRAESAIIDGGPSTSNNPPRLNGPSTTVSTCLLIHFSASNCSTWQNSTLRDKQNYLYNVYPACIIFYPPSEWQMQLAVMGKL